MHGSKDFEIWVINSKSRKLTSRITMLHKVRIKPANGNGFHEIKLIETSYCGEDVSKLGYILIRS